MGKEKKEPVKLVNVLFVGLIIISIFLPSEVSFMALISLVVGYLILGFLVPECFDDLSKIIGTWICLILLIEGAHAITAYGYGIPIKGVSVGLLGISDGQGEMMSGWVELNIEKSAVDASPVLQSQMSWVAAAGSIVLVIFGFAYFVLPSAGNLAAILASLCFFKHQAPFLWNDQSYMVGAGWMSPIFAYVIFFLGIFVLLMAGLYATKKMKERAI